VDEEAIAHWSGRGWMFVMDRETMISDDIRIEWLWWRANVTKKKSLEDKS